ncbi:MAG: EAL domain-containing protein [Pseudomonadales bacterium]|nr:EAL domain-containing protein [Pseudomonadales bacterium]
MKLLLVEDDRGDARFLRACLTRSQGSPPDLIHEVCLNDALAVLKEQSFDVVLLDLNLPDASGEACVRAIKQVNPNVPIVVLSGDDSEEYAIGILNEGVQDYLVKWDGEGKGILRAIRYAIERKRTELRLNHLATYDSLTQIPNRHYFVGYLEKAVSRARRHGAMLGLVFLDLDRFKGVNDTLGHHFGDKLLIAASERIRKAVRNGDVVARMGGDEFAVLLEQVPDIHAAEAVARKLTHVLSEPYLLDGHQVNTSVSIGVTIFPNDRGDPDTLIKNADIAMYQAKNSGRNGFKFFTESMHREIVHQHAMAQDMRRALDDGEFFLLYQPQFRLDGGGMCGAEALIRWQRRDGRMMMPNDFIGIAEELGQIIPLGRWVAQTAFLQSVAWQQAGYRPGRVAINVSPRQILHVTFCEELEQLINRYRIDPQLIEIEVTESCLVQDVRTAQRALDNLKHLGFTLAIDDFGTGHSCLDYLRRYPIDTLKLDRSFVRDIGVNRHGPAICRAILSMAESLDMDTVAEGIETEEQLAFLLEHGCRRGQGYYFSRPVSAADIAARLELELAATEQEIKHG